VAPHLLCNLKSKATRRGIIRAFTTDEGLVGIQSAAKNVDGTWFVEEINVIQSHSNQCAESKNKDEP
jgi:hypothetical protein